MSAPFLTHTATKLDGASGRVVVCGSHGGSYAARLVLAAGVRAVLFNDAGVGRDQAGIAGLALCQNAGVAAAVLDFRSCRIGDAASAMRTGIVSHTNPLAAALGLAPGVSAADAAVRLDAAASVEPIPLTTTEHRRADTVGGRRLVIIDSVSLVRPGEDDGAIVISASHGGLLGGDPATAGRADAHLFAFNDAGGGLDGAGFSRLPALQERGIAAVTVDCWSARIGDGASTWADGIVSRANEAAAALGAARGTALHRLVDAMT